MIRPTRMCIYIGLSAIHILLLFFFFFFFFGGGGGVGVGMVSLDSV